MQVIRNHALPLSILALALAIVLHAFVHGRYVAWSDSGGMAAWRADTVTGEVRSTSPAGNVDWTPRLGDY